MLHDSSHQLHLSVLLLIMTRSLPATRTVTFCRKIAFRSNQSCFQLVCISNMFLVLLYQIYTYKYLQPVDPSTRHRYCCVFKSFHSGDRFRKFAFSSKTIHRFHVDGTPKTQQCLRFQMKTHPCGRGLSY